MLDDKSSGMAWHIFIDTKVYSEYMVEMRLDALQNQYDG